MHLIPLTQVFFIFRSGSVNNNWMNIYSFVEDLVKKFEKYGFSKSQGVFPTGRVHSCLDSVGMGAPRVRSTEPRGMF